MRKRNLKIKQVFAGLCCAAMVGGMLPLLPAQAVLVRTNSTETTLHCDRSQKCSIWTRF